jgi:glutamate racemase
MRKREAISVIFSNSPILFRKSPLKKNRGIKRGRILITSSIMECKPVVFFDSGIGGLPYLEMARQRVAEEFFIYLADRKHFPYGVKTPSEILTGVMESLGLAIRRFDPRAVVVACNTASVIALAELRKRYDIPFIGVVPAVKPAARSLSAVRLAVLATERTLADNYLADLIRNFADGCEVIRYPLGKLVNLVEYDYFSTSAAEKRAIVSREVGKLKNSAVSSAVLGCTHFILLEEELKSAMGGEVDIVDSREGVTRQLIRVLKDKGSGGGCPGRRDCFYVTGEAPVEERYRKFAGKYGLEFAGILK